jgi:acyl transferase domain-containing protein
VYDIRHYADISSLFSNEGHLFSFDYRANSFGRGEGVGCVLLRPLDQALKCNDSIRSLVVGSGVNQDGRTNGITTPSEAAQKSLIRSVYHRAGLDACDTCFVEAHGTGTKIGDPIEASALHECFQEGRTARKPFYMGSVNLFVLSFCHFHDPRKYTRSGTRSFSPLLCEVGLVL